MGLTLLVSPEPESLQLLPLSRLWPPEMGDPPAQFFPGVLFATMVFFSVALPGGLPPLDGP